MSPDDYQKVKEIFQSALDLNEEERAAFLDEKRSVDPLVVLEVERLLDSYQPSYLEQPAFNLLENTGGTLKSGQQIGQFTIVEKIGAGGMGEVYLAEDGKLGRQVAVKLLPDLFTNDEERLRRFQQEARTASALNHPNILTIYDFGESGKRHYIATEFINGETLRGRLNRGRQSVADTLEIAIQTASALQAAHEAGIIHRDIKPENIMLRRDGLVKILDFGLAKLDDTKDRSVSHEAPTEHYVRTIPGVIMGTVQYMSPEQARGQSTDARTDIWSLGCVIYEMLTGEAPFRGDSTADQIAEIVKSQPAPIATSVVDVPDRLEEIVAKSIEKDPDERYQTVKDLLIDLKRLNRSLDIESELLRSNPEGLRVAESERNGNSPHSPEKTSSVEYLVVGMKLHKRTAIGIIAGLVALVGGTAYVARTYWRNSNDARFEYADKIKLAVQALETSNLAYVRQLLDETKPKPGEEDLTGFEWGYLSQQYAERSAFQPMKLQHQAGVDTIAFSPDGSTVATAGFDNTIHLWDAATGSEIKKFPGHTALIISVVFSPDGTKLLSGSFDKTARIWDIESGAQLLAVEDQSRGIGCLFFLENGKKFAGENGSIKVWDSTTGAEILGPTKPLNVGYPLAVSLDGRLFAAQDSDQMVVVWEAATGRQMRKLEAKAGFLNDLKFSPDSKQLLAGGSEGSAKLWDLKTGRVKTFPGHTGPIRDVAFSRNGKTIATGSEDNTVKVWDAERGFEITTLRGHADGVIALAFSPDNLKLASGSSDGTALIWNVPKSESRGVLRGHSANVEDVVFSHDGKLLASASNDKTAKIWEVPTERERLTLSGHTAPISSGDFSPNDKVLATGSQDGKVTLWDTVTGKKNFSFDSTAPVAKAVFSPNGKLIATGHFWDDPEVRLWESETGTARCSFRSGGAWDIQFSKDGNRITASDGIDSVRLWDVASCGEVRSFKGGDDDKYAAAFRNDGKLIKMLILNNGRSLALIEAETGKKIASILGHDAGLKAAILSPNGKRLVTSAEDSTVRIWDTATGQELLSIKLGAVANKIAFSPSGKILAAALQDGTVRLWRSEGN